MSVTAFDLQDQICCPHHYGHKPDNIEKDFHLYRFYSPRVLHEFLQHDPRNTKMIGIENLLSYEGARRACMNILRCGSVPDPPARSWPDLEKFENSLCTSRAHHFTGTTLMLTKGADYFYEVSVQPLLAHILGCQEEGVAPEDFALRRLLKKPWQQVGVVNSLEHAQRYGVKLEPHHIRASPPLPSDVAERSAINIAASSLCGVLLMGARSEDNFYALTAQHLAE